MFVPLSNGVARLPAIEMLHGKTQVGKKHGASAREAHAIRVAVSIGPFFDQDVGQKNCHYRQERAADHIGKIVVPAHWY